MLSPASTNDPSESDIVAPVLKALPAHAGRLTMRKGIMPWRPGCSLDIDAVSTAWPLSKVNNSCIESRSRMLEGLALPHKISASGAGVSSTC